MNKEDSQDVLDSVQEVEPTEQGAVVADEGDEIPSLADLMPSIRAEIENGTLSEETRASLNLLGISDDDIEMFSRMSSEDSGNDTPSQPEIDDPVAKEFGGQEVVNKALEWAGKNMGQLTASHINDQLNSNDDAVRRNGFNTLMREYYNSQTPRRAPNIITSKTRARATRRDSEEYKDFSDIERDVGSSMEKVLNQDTLNRFMNDPQYQQKVVDRIAKFRTRNPRKSPITDRTIGNFF